MVELRTKRREIRGDGANYHEKLGIQRISCASQFTIPDMAGTSPDLACNNTNTRSSQPNQASRTPDFSEWKMLHNFAIVLQSRWKTNRWHIYHSPRDCTPIIDYQELKEEKERQLTYNGAYN